MATETPTTGVTDQWVGTKVNGARCLLTAIALPGGITTKWPTPTVLESNAQVPLKSSQVKRDLKSSSEMPKADRVEESSNSPHREA